MPETRIPGIAHQPLVISSTCRQNRGDAGAVDEALARAGLSLLELLENWPQEKGATFWLVPTVDRDGRRSLEELERRPTVSELRQEVIDGFLEQRGLTRETVCKGCGGMGRRVYGSTSTWHGGPGGQMMTADVCNKCWGSGNAEKPGVNLKRYERDMAELKRLREAQA